jgi:hypothetical protein
MDESCAAPHRLCNLVSSLAQCGEVKVFTPDAQSFQPASRAGVQVCQAALPSAMHHAEPLSMLTNPLSCLQVREQAPTCRPVPRVRAGGPRAGLPPRRRDAGRGPAALHGHLRQRAEAPDGEPSTASSAPAPQPQTRAHYGPAVSRILDTSHDPFALARPAGAPPRRAARVGTRPHDLCGGAVRLASALAAGRGAERLQHGRVRCEKAPAPNSWIQLRSPLGRLCTHLTEGRRQPLLPTTLASGSLARGPSVPARDVSRVLLPPQAVRAARPAALAHAHRGPVARAQRLRQGACRLCAAGEAAHDRSSCARMRAPPLSTVDVA